MLSRLDLEKVRAEKHLLEKDSSGAICFDDVLQFRIGGLFQGHNIPDWFRVCSDFLYISMSTVNFVETRSSVPVFVTSIVLIPFANFLIKVLIFI